MTWPPFFSAASAHRAHQADAPAAIDEFNLFAGELRA
jgi:hypothetical protein